MSSFILSQCSSWQSTSMGPLDSNKTFKSVTYSSSKHSPMLWTPCEPNHNQHIPNSHLAYLCFIHQCMGLGIDVVHAWVLNTMIITQHVNENIAMKGLRLSKWITIDKKGLCPLAFLMTTYFCALFTMSMYVLCNITICSFFLIPIIITSSSPKLLPTSKHLETQNYVVVWWSNGQVVLFHPFQLA